MASKGKIPHLYSGLGLGGAKFLEQSILEQSILQSEPLG